MRQLVGMGLVMTASCVACGGGGEPRAAAAQAVVQEVSAGTVAFAVDGQPRSFSHLPASHNVSTPVSGSILARPAADAVEQLMITVMGVNLKNVAFPAELPLPRDPARPLAGLATVGFSYKAPDGVEWAGPGRLRIDAFASDGVIAGTFTGVSLPHTGKQRPNVVLTAGTFRAKISAPW